MKLNLGCNSRSFEGFVGVDCAPGPGVDLIVELNRQRLYLSPDGTFVMNCDPWPWEDSTVEEVLAYDVFEHLPDKRHTMNELWRVLKPGGLARIQVPHATDGDGGHCDPTHRSYWTTSDFEYYVPGIAEYDRFHTSPYYGIQAAFRVVGSVNRTRYARTYGGHVIEIQATLEAVK